MKLNKFACDAAEKLLSKFCNNDLFELGSLFFRSRAWFSAKEVAWFASNFIERSDYVRTKFEKKVLLSRGVINRQSNPDNLMYDNFDSKGRGMAGWRMRLIEQEKSETSWCP